MRLYVLMGLIFVSLYAIAVCREFAHDVAQQRLFSVPTHMTTPSADDAPATSPILAPQAFVRDE